MSVREGFGTVTPYLLTEDLERTLAFLRGAFGAEERFRTTGEAGGTHVEVRIGDSMVMVGGPAAPLRTMLFLYVEDPDSVYAAALAAGATSIESPRDTANGRRAAVEDADGTVWYVGRP